MLSTGGKVSQMDPAVFYWLDEQCNVTGLRGAHVDDFLSAGSQNYLTDVVPKLKSASHMEPTWNISTVTLKTCSLSTYNQHVLYKGMLLLMRLKENQT